MLMTFRRVWIQLTADRKRFGALCAALAVGMLLWARLIVVARMPRTAIAEDKALAKAAQNQPSGPAAAPSQLVTLNVELISVPRQDPFVISPQHFPKPIAAPESSPVAGKSSSKPAEEPYQIEARRIAALADIIERLRLEAVVTGSLVVINGKTYRTGDSWTVNLASPTTRTSDDGTTVRIRVEEVKHRSAILETEPLEWLGGERRRFEIQMASPGG